MHVQTSKRTKNLQGLGDKAVEGRLDTRVAAALVLKLFPDGLKSLSVAAKKTQRLWHWWGLAAVQALKPLVLEVGHLRAK
jgi:hypothetical protein